MMYRTLLEQRFLVDAVCCDSLGKLSVSRAESGGSLFPEDEAGGC